MTTNQPDPPEMGDIRKAGNALANAMGGRCVIQRDSGLWRVTMKHATHNGEGFVAHQYWSEDPMVALLGAASRAVYDARCQEGAGG